MLDEAIKRAALEAAQRSWSGNPSFDRAVLLGAEAAIKAMREQEAAAQRDMEAGNG